MKQTTLEAWLEWKERCALALCKEETQHILTAWGATIFRNAIRKLNSQHELAQQQELLGGRVDPAWSWMEVHLVAGKRAQGKRYKDNLLDCARDSLTAEEKRTALEKYFATVCRNEARRLLTKDRAEKTETQLAGDKGVNLVSLSEPAHSNPDGLTFADLYNKEAAHEGLMPDSMAAKAEIQRIAQLEAQAWLPQMTLRQKLVWGCLTTDKPLNDPVLWNLAECEQSQFYAEKPKLEAVLRLFKDTLEAKYSEERNDEATVMELVLCACTELAYLCQQSLPPENPRDSRL